jgi:hypothetical protein
MDPTVLVAPIDLEGPCEEERKMLEESEMLTQQLE